MGIKTIYVLCFKVNFSARISVIENNNFYLKMGISWTGKK
jgi:hypothetical protein